MTSAVREMALEEVAMVIDYFHGATPEHLERLGVDPSRLPGKSEWRTLYERDYAQPRERRRCLLLVWELDRTPVGFSTADRIVYGEEAFMHLHVLDASNRNQGHGAAFVRTSAERCFSMLNLKRLLCEPNAFNVAPNRTLQKAGFRYARTYNTVPGPINFHQAVTQWVMETPLTTWTGAADTSPAIH